MIRISGFQTHLGAQATPESDKSQFRSRGPAKLKFAGFPVNQLSPLEGYGIQLYVKPATGKRTNGLTLYPVSISKNLAIRLRCIR